MENQTELEESVIELEIVLQHNTAFNQVHKCVFFHLHTFKVINQNYDKPD